MITRIELSGFKSFTDFTMDLAPLTVIAGANAAGKSNLLDALRVIRGLTQGVTLSNALSNRGNAKDFFTKYGKNSKSNIINMAVELLVPPVHHSGHGGFHLDGTRFRYELRIHNEPDNSEPFQIDYEKLSFIDKEEDDWGLRYVPVERRDAVLKYRSKTKKELLYRGIDSQTGEFLFGAFSDRLGISGLGAVSGSYSLHLAAIRASLLNISYSQLFDADNFSNFHNRKENDSLILKELKELAIDSRDDLSLLSMRVGQIVKSIKRINVEVDNFDRLSLIAEDRNGARYLFDSLSEGTLRAIALATLLFSKSPDRTILLEEPENGIDPRVLRQVVELLTDLATDFSTDDQPNVQVICTTHSPALLEMIVGHPNAKHATGYLTTTVNKLVDSPEEKFTTSATRIQPIIKDISLSVSDSRAERMTLRQAKMYMEYGLPNSFADA